MVWDIQSVQDSHNVGHFIYYVLTPFTKRTRVPYGLLKRNTCQPKELLNCNLHQIALQLCPFKTCILVTFNFRWLGSLDSHRTWACLHLPLEKHEVETEYYIYRVYVETKL